MCRLYVRGRSIAVRTFLLWVPRRRLRRQERPPVLVLFPGRGDQPPDLIDSRRLRIRHG